MSARDLLKKYEADINKHDFNLIEPLISADCTFWFSSGTHKGHLESRRAFEKTWAMIVDEVYSLTNIEWLTESDTAAVCTYTYHWKGQINGEFREGQGRGTSCFRVENSVWKIVHEHLSLFPK